MSKEKRLQSALFIGNGDDDAAVLVVGGQGGNGTGAALLTSRPHQGRAQQGSGGGDPWRWRQLSPMRKKRYNRPGILLLGRERVLVVGGGSKTAEVLQLPRDYNDRGVWTLLTQPLSRDFYRSFLVNFNNRVVAVGELHIHLVRITSTLCMSIMNCLHFRQEQALRRVDDDIHFQASGKKILPHPTITKDFVLLQVSFCISGCTAGVLRVETPVRCTGRR